MTGYRRANRSGIDAAAATATTAPRTRNRMTWNRTPGGYDR